MPTAMRVSAASFPLTCLVLLSCLVACSSVKKLDGAVPAGVDLNGTWKLNRADSDDPARLFEKLPESRRHDGPPQRGADDDGLGMPDERAPPRGERRALRESRSPAEVLGDLRSGRGLLRIRQRPGEIVIDNGLRSRKFVPGEATVVSVPGGVADQSSGFAGREFVVDTAGRNRPEVIERYSVSPDRKRLTVAIKVNGHGQMKNIDWKRVYDAVPADTVADGPST